MSQKPLRFAPRTTAKDEKFTPLRYLYSVRRVLKEIDIDPFSCFEANLRVKAKQIFTKENTGFYKNWNGRIFSNPPYGRGFLDNFEAYARQEWENGHITEAIFLLPNRTDMKWFHRLLAYDLPVCLVDHRISFVDGFRFIKDAQEITSEFPSAKLLTSPEEGSAFFYLGNNPIKFAKEFIKWGTIINIVPIIKEEKKGNHAINNTVSTSSPESKSN